eukprot:TRINITY_DN10804_c0_g1_i1.p1 TRINITY_DN10804_c0_g1~~TRINITY_DN10804_c0_g1_i1.p1  ORF type:complete len:236 (+),score=33.64 TRINITY_DN10804_c0_g1_i1:354-1061(+)
MPQCNRSSVFQMGNCGSGAKLATDGRFLVLSNHERQATVWTIADGRKMCSISENSNRKYDLGARVCTDRLVLRVGKTIQVYDLTVHAGYWRAASESLGVSLNYLIGDGGLREAAAMATGLSDPTFHELAPAMAYGDRALTAGHVCPRDGRPGCALVVVMPSGPATHFLSWVWSYLASTMVEALLAWAKDHDIDAQITCVWICYFCNNQVRILSEMCKEGSDDLEKTFESRLKQIG